MKKIFCFLLMVAISIAMTGCGEEPKTETNVPEEKVTINHVGDEVVAHGSNDDSQEVGEELVSADAVNEEIVGADEASEEAISVEEEYTDSSACAYEGNPQLIFATEDIDGYSIASENLGNQKLIMVNFWEPWCGPCVGEMSDLERLYQEYQSSGFIILGVFSTPGVDGDVREVMEYCGTTYPIIRYTDSMEFCTTEYVPTTVFMDEHGHLLTDQPYIGSNSYEGWKQIIEQYLYR